MSIFDSLEDFSWDILYKLEDFGLPLAGVFEKYNLPATLFPASILLLLTLIIISFSAQSAYAPEVCGDGMCTQSEDFLNCPADCSSDSQNTTDTKRITVELSGMPGCVMTLRAYNSAAVLQGEQSGNKASFVFDEVGSDSIYLELTDIYGKIQTTPTQNLNEQESTIEVTLDDGMCESKVSQYGKLILTVKDKDTNAPLNGVRASIVVIENGRTVDTLERDSLVNTQREFSLKHGTSYAIIARKEGYNDYDGTTDPVVVPPDHPVSKTVYMESSQTNPPGDIPVPPNTPVEDITGDLEVCLSDGGDPITEGLITIDSISGQRIASGNLADDLLEEGCYLFSDISAGSLVTASVTNPPAGCLPESIPRITIPYGEVQTVTMELDCPGNTSSLRVKIFDEGGNILTQNATITVWTEDDDMIPGNGFASSLGLGAEHFTEELSVPPLVGLYVWVRGLPEDYEDYRSEVFSIREGMRKDLVIRLNDSEGPTRPPVPDDPTIPPGPGQPPVYEGFSFNGATSPRTVSPSQTFSASIESIYYSGERLTDPEVRLTANIDIDECSVYYDTIWHIDCFSPSELGEYDLEFHVRYDGREETKTLPIRVIHHVSDSGQISVTPVLSTRGEPPLELFYEILFAGEPLQNFGYEATLTYKPSPDAYPGTLSPLDFVEDLGFWKVDADVLYKGDYTIDLFIELERDDTLYQSEYTLEFTSTANSETINLETYFSNDIVDLEDSVSAEVILTAGSKTLNDLTVFQLYVDDVLYAVPWDPVSKTYSVSFAAPPDEACTLPIYFLINSASLEDGEEKIHVFDMGSRYTSLTCPIDNADACDSLDDVRACIIKHKTGQVPYELAKIYACISSGCPVNTLRCPSSDKGDLVRDCAIQQTDVYAARDVMNVLGNPAERNKYVECMDMDHDNDVDEDDMTCLRNLASGVWQGDVGSGVTSGDGCESSLNGGFCLNIPDDTELPGDFNEDEMLDREDIADMQKIISAVSAGVRPTQVVLDIADFNQDGTVDNYDLTCIQNISRAVDFMTGEPRPSNVKISASCLKIFGLQCHGTYGNLNGDGWTDHQDILIMRLMAEGIIPQNPNLMDCADPNDDGRVDDLDLLCVEDLFYSGNDGAVWRSCFGCDEDLPAEAYGDEVCGDGVDNNCDGLFDLVPGHADERCRCNDQTPCSMIKDGDGVPGTRSTTIDLFCRKLNWQPHTGYEWVTQDLFTCPGNNRCRTYSCGSDLFQCSGPPGNWYNMSRQVSYNCRRCSQSSGGKPPVCINTFCHTTPLPSEVCGDGWDNDCSGGDATCPSGSCFPAGTMILLADGSSRAIEDIKVGDFVMSFNEVDQTQEPAKVLELENPIRDHIYTLSLSDGREIEVTREHPFYTKEQKWASLYPPETYEESGLVVSAIEAGNHILDQDGKWVRINSISYEEIPEGIQTYNLKVVNKNNNYYADGLLVHNKGGCLYVYSKADDSFVLDHLAYPHAITPAREDYTFGTLDGINPDDGLLTIKLSEELPEISNVDLVRLFSVKHPKDTRVVANSTGSVHLIKSLRSPIYCESIRGEDCLAQISKEDGDRYYYDLGGYSLNEIGTIYDSLEMGFEVPEGAKTAKVLVSGYESGLTAFVWWKVLEAVGAENVDTLHALLAKGTPYSSMLDDFIDNYAEITIQVLTKDGWKSIASELVGYSKTGLNTDIIGSVNIDDLPPGDLKVRIKTAVSTYELDYCAVDFEDALDARLEELPMVSATDGQGRDVADALAIDDNQYLVLSRGDIAEVVFHDPKSSDEDTSYVLGIKGHYTFDVSEGGSLDMGTIQWIIRLLTDEDYLLRYAHENYPSQREEFFDKFFG